MATSDTRGSRRRPAHRARRPAPRGGGRRVGEDPPPGWRARSAEGSTRL